MARQPYDPLTFVPAPDVIQKKLRETLTLAERLRLLRELSERLRLSITTADTLTPSAERQGVCCA